ncbi:uncharacterized protein LOC128198078 [Bicyclus anynana]|uniref:Uncharacterized protein LOC128198078 n=1 Tax=Bicyclus anynana TaxID=110368 RepID=A0ABM3LE85_BICAN|nr:uncharacterized protein LOC128198078 [Bicyclus anynana]XP_052737385.1 uncharacterized protein LOC128198078 [Bicyclus anynana]
MSLFVDLRHIKSSVSNLSEMVDKISTSVCKDKIQKERKQSVDSALYGSSIYKPTTLGFGVRFSQSQEDIFNDTPSSRLRSHMSLPNLGKNEKTSTPRTKIVEINGENNASGNKNTIQISPDNINDWIIATLNKRPHFDDGGQTHPVDFIESIKYYISVLNMDNDRKINFIISCLEGLPLMWARCFRNEFQDVEDFYEAFEQEFWGPDRQKSILCDMKLGKYDENKSRMTMSEYFLFKVSNYKHLSPPPSDLEIVYSLAAHFPSVVELELRLTPKPTLREAYSLLRRREGEANDFLPNYLYEMCETFQRGSRSESARRPEEQPSSSGDDKNKPKK